MLQLETDCDVEQARSDYNREQGTGPIQRVSVHFTYFHSAPVIQSLDGEVQRTILQDRLFDESNVDWSSCVAGEGNPVT
jgi:hypothetical protein